MHTPVYLQIVYWLSTPLLAILVVVFVRRKLYQRFPVFFAYVVVACLSDILRFLAYRVSFKVYLIIYWNTQLLNIILAVGAIGELFLRRIFPGFHKVRFYRYLFPIVAAIVALLATLTSLETIRISVVIDTLRAVDFVRVSTLGFFVALMLFMGRTWAKYEFAIASGFAVDAAAFLASFALDVMRLFRGVVALLPVVAYDLACIIWLVSFLRAERFEPETPPPVSAGLVREAREWEQALKDPFSGKKRSE